MCRAFLTSCPTKSVLVKLDFANAFNTLRRDHMLRTVASHVPDLLHLVTSSYREPSDLLYDDVLMHSSSGVQQGDPLGPALYCLGAKELVDSLDSPLNLWYLDDGSLGGDLSVVLADIEKVTQFEDKSGLRLNPSKCEVFVDLLDEDERDLAIQSVRSLLPGCRVVHRDDLELLGAPIFAQATTPALEAKLSRARAMIHRLELLGSHAALFLLRSSLSSVRFLHVLRCSDTRQERVLRQIDLMFREALSDILNIDLTDSHFDQACLPTRMGGLGIRSTYDLAAPCILSSLHASRRLVQDLLSENQFEAFTCHLTRILEDFCSSGRAPPEKTHKQKEWDAVLCAEKSDEILTSLACNKDRARFRAVSSPGASNWLKCLPSANLGTLLDDNTIRVCVGLRIGAKIVEPHTCTCGQTVTEDGSHGISCARSAGRWSRHSQINDTFSRALRSAQIPNMREPPGMCRNDGRRPDGVTLIPFERGKALVWDGTVVDTLAPSYVDSGSNTPGHAVSRAEALKLQKYTDLASDYFVSPLAFETLGGPGPATRDLLITVGHLLQEATGCNRAGQFLLQKLSLDVQRGNAAAVMGTLEGFRGPLLGLPDRRS